jgi:exopolysaccharide biosynthesis predicted pyruvyltransferase EpsI
MAMRDVLAGEGRSYLHFAAVRQAGSTRSPSCTVVLATHGRLARQRQLNTLAASGGKTVSGGELVDRLSKLLIESFAPLIRRDEPIGLIGFPETANCGDHATWLGEKKLLNQLGLSPAYECSAQSYDPEQMRKTIGSGTILMHGGSNFGDRHTAYHEFRLRVLDDFPGNRVIVFPHHVTYLDNDYLQRTSAPIGRHPDVTLFARSLMTQHLLARHFAPRARVELAPDLAFLLGPLARATAPVYDVVWIARTDSARAGDQTEVAARLASQAAEKFLLPKFPDGIDVNFVVKQRPPTVLLTDWFSLFFENEQARTAIRKLPFDAQSEVYVARALHMLSLGHLVVTDRLLAHVLCILLGIPHVLLNDDSGKNWHFHETWTRDAGLCRLARTPTEAWSFARNAAQKAKDQPPRSAGWQWDVA